MCYNLYFIPSESDHLIGPVRPLKERAFTNTNRVYKSEDLKASGSELFTQPINMLRGFSNRVSSKQRLDLTPFFFLLDEKTSIFLPAAVWIKVILKAEERRPRYRIVSCQKMKEPLDSASGMIRWNRSPIEAETT